MSSDRIARALVCTCLLASACADVRRGEYWDEPSADGSGEGQADDAATTEGSGDETGPSATTTGAATDEGSGSSGEPPPSFADVLPLLRSGCEDCHSATGEASDTDYVLGSDDADVYAMTLEFIDLDQPAQSRLLTKTAGIGHNGGTVFDEGTTEYQTILEWIEAGANP